jgi:hypothetical protein
MKVNIFVEKNKEKNSDKSITYEDLACIWIIGTNQFCKSLSFWTKERQPLLAAIFKKNQKLRDYP